MEGNAWRVLHDIALPIDDVPVVILHESICNRERGAGGVFFFNKTQLIMII